MKDKFKIPAIIIPRYLPNYNKVEISNKKTLPTNIINNYSLEFNKNSITNLCNTLIKLLLSENNFNPLATIFIPYHKYHDYYSKHKLIRIKFTKKMLLSEEEYELSILLQNAQGFKNTIKIEQVNTLIDLYIIDIYLVKEI